MPRPAIAVLLALPGLLAPWAAGPAAQARGGSADPLPAISQFSAVRPTDWAYQALVQLIERHGCVAGFADGRFAGERALSRFEAAAALQACLERVSSTTDSERRLLREFERELAMLRGRVDGLEARVGTLEALQFSPTSRLSGQATFVVGANGFSGSASDLVNRNRASFGATTFNYDVQLTVDTSFTGKDLLRANLRAGSFDSATNSFGGGGPSSLSVLEVAFQEDAGPDVLGIDRLYYQAPLGRGFTLTAGGRVGQEDMLALWPSVYPADTVLDVLTLAGAPTAYNRNIGAGAGLWWQHGGWSVSANYVAANAGEGAPASGGIGTTGSASSGTVQLGYQQESWGAAFLYSAVQNGATSYGTAALMQVLSPDPPTSAVPNLTHAFALSGYWQPARSGWVPSISAGWGISSTTYNLPQPPGSPTLSQSWSVGLQWLDALQRGNAAGLAFGQAPFITAQSGGITPNDANWLWEWWYRFQLSDQISLTPALFYLWRPLGQDTPAGTSFQQLGALVKTSFRF